MNINIQWIQIRNHTLCLHKKTCGHVKYEIHLNLTCKHYNQTRTGPNWCNVTEYSCMSTDSHLKWRIISISYNQQ